MWAFMLSRKSPSPVIERSSLAVSAIRQAFGTAAVVPAFQASMVSKYMCGEDGVELGQPGAVVEVAASAAACCTFWVTRR